MGRLSGAVSLARAAAALALKDETIAAARSSATVRSFAAIVAARPSCSSSSSPSAWSEQSVFSPTLSAQQETRKLPWSSWSRAVSNSAASSSAAREEDEEDAADNSSSSTATSAERNKINTATVVSASTSSTSSPTVSYVAPLSATVHRLKRLSLFSCLLTTAAAPTLAATEAMPPAAREVAAAGIAGFGLFTTGLLHWFVGPYVHELTWRDGDGDGDGNEGADSSVIEVTTLDVLGRKQKMLLPLSRVAAPPDGSIHPQATFSDSETDRLYYVDVDNFVSVASEAGGGGRRQRERAAALLEKLVVVAEKAEEEATSKGGEEKRTKKNKH